MKNILFVLLPVLFLGGVSEAQSRRTSRPAGYGFQVMGSGPVKTVMPPNNLHLMDRRERAANINEEQFNSIVDGVAATWSPIAKSKGVELVFHKKWDDPTVNAMAYQEGNTWHVEMYGGLARRPEVTPDGFALVVCHELGHHFGGYPFVSGWASNEGQSDYFASQVCLKSLWGRDLRGNERFRRLQQVPDVVQASCTQAWPNNSNAQGWCVRAAAAGQSLSNLLNANKGGQQPHFETPDKTQVPSTVSSHPNAQCRLDTYFAGALCTKGWDMNLIPGKGQGNTAAAEAAAMPFSCTEKENFSLGTRPRCWFKPLL
ncbi:MAG: hypothetical protein KF802_15535 [Bdellovibrionaceae bacterium]|nr:hypothetical protein [Pseudobdellovibrionaceae bacterium]MBX3033499.1 hypothetical protein [Pseudobdellovibrionaceae bacterium]